ncbi:MAG: type II toxin-antitoxin system VapC family toxin [Acidobacteriota bacterium]|nr:type II toxin-antitoxin system VapC family toxin [Acidobacteriota bacterium]
MISKTSSIFLDANILVYATFPGLAFFEASRSRLKEIENGGALLWTSRQVLREFIATASREGAVSPQPALLTIFKSVRDFEARFEIAEDDAATTALLLELVGSRSVRGRQVHDANIAATMRRHHIPTLLTRNTKDFVRYTPEITVMALVV